MTEKTAESRNRTQTQEAAEPSATMINNTGGPNTDPTKRSSTILCAAS